MNVWRWGVVAAGLALPTMAMACGACDEDTVAATYDHPVAQRAITRGQVLVFASIEGIGDAKALANRAGSAARRVAGVDRASVRVSAAPLALSFAIDPKMQTVEGAIVDVQHRGHDQDIRLSVVRVVR
ncbi:MAG: hypothetical protein ABI981_10120 [Betaproteobacteria bacterium]